MQLIHELGKVADFEQARIRLAELINMSEPAPEAVVRRAIADQQYAIYLMLTKDSPTLQRQLLKMVQPSSTTLASNATTGASTRPPLASATADSSTLSNSALLKQASTAFVKWGRSGFRQIDDTVRERRWSACMKCHYLVDPPDTMLYQGLRLLAGKDTKICSACGCAADKKVGIPTESCPVQSDDDLTLSKWGETYKPRQKS